MESNEKINYLTVS